MTRNRRYPVGTGPSVHYGTSPDEAALNHGERQGRGEAGFARVNDARTPYCAPGGRSSGGGTGRPCARSAAVRIAASEPVWSRDGREILYRNGAEMWAVEVMASDTEFRVVGSELLFEAPYLNDPDGAGIGNANYDVSLDGQHFLMVAAAGDGPRGLVLVLNWTEELGRLLSAD